jgi:hypothetical protein
MRFTARRAWTRAFPRIGPIGLGFSFIGHAAPSSPTFRQSLAYRLRPASILERASYGSGFADAVTIQFPHDFIEARGHDACFDPLDPGKRFDVRRYPGRRAVRVP